MGVTGIVTGETAQGPRSHQEDRYVVHPFALAGGLRGHLLAVMDGHGGSGAADECAASISGLFSLSGPDDLEPALERIVAGLDERTRTMRSGATISVACILESHSTAAIGILGDSPVVAVDRDDRIITSPEHNVRTNLEERKRAEARGGVYTGGYLMHPTSGHGLQIARALGDRGLEGILSREPTVYTIHLGPRSVVVLASDGLLDPAHGESQQLIHEMISLRERSVAFDAPALIAWAERRGLEDNATAVVWAGSGAETR